ncbi:MAG: hypothetical protein O2884_10730 [Chloroflexi bacterium]|nr:hypothetical protein [Chloroflexota bacterium]
MPIVVLPFGALVDLLGARITVGTAGATLAVAVLLVAALKPTLWRKPS